jgi:hypothetical protein
MTNLSERVMSLSGPDRLLDANIHWRIQRDDFDADEDYTDETYCYAQHGWTMNRADHGFLDSIPVPRYTSSIDAAMTLVPEGDPAFSATFWRLGNDGEGADPAEFKAEILLCSMLTSKRLSATASTPALALCAAALLAREASNGDL